MTDSNENLISVRLSSDKMEAMLTIEKGINPEYVTAESILAQALSLYVQQNPALSNKIKEAVSSFTSHNFEAEPQFSFLLAEGIPPQDGHDGSFLLNDDLQERYDSIRARPVSVEDEPRHTADSKNGQDESESLDHKQRTAFLIVRNGEMIGNLAPATDGTDGMDVCGKNIAAKPGKQDAVSFDQNTIETHDSGSVISKVAGQLIIDPSSIHISPNLDLSGSVDFSTGNIEFPGNVFVAEGVKDCFHINSGKSITINGLVEAADLMACRDLTLNRGMAGRDKGTLMAARDMHANYLNNVICRVGQDLYVDKEICDCDVEVTRNLISPSATVMGGKLSVLAECEVGQLGSDGGAHTIISLGSAMEIDRMLKESVEICGDIGAEIAEKNRKLRELKEDLDFSSTKAERMTQLGFEISMLESKIAPLKERIQTSMELIKKHSQPTLTIQKLLNQGVVIVAQGHRAVVSQSIKGPISITLNHEGEFVLTDINSNQSVEMCSIATIERDTDSYDRSILPADLKSAA